MEANRILLVGRGHLGQFLKRRLNVPDELHWTGDMDVLSEEVLKMARPNVIVNAAGKTDLAWCEANPLEAFRCNVTAPLNLFRRARDANASFIHLSSGCVWDGPYFQTSWGAERPFEPHDPPNPACFYAWTKAACDAMMLWDVHDWQGAAHFGLTILRPRQVYSPDPSPRNTLSKILKYPLLIDTPNSMTSAETIAKAIEWSLGSSYSCMCNVYDLGVTSPYQVGCFLASAGLRDFPKRMTKMQLDEDLKPKRVDAVLSDPYFERRVGVPLVQDELRRVIAEYKVNLGP